MRHVRDALCGILLGLGSVTLLHAQDHIAQGQRIRFQFKDAATYRDTKEVEVKTAVMIRGLWNDSSSREARIRILVSNLESDLCDSNAKAFGDLVSPIALTGDADFVLEFSIQRASKTDP